MERTAPRQHLRRIADALEARSGEAVALYERRLVEMDSSLVAAPVMREQLEAQARSVLEDVVRDLRGQEKRLESRQDDSLSATIGASRALEGVHPSESLRAVVALSEAALSVAAEHLTPPSPTSKSEVATVALAVQRSILERVARASVSYGDHLLAKLHDAYAEERQRIGRELHDRVAHMIMVVFRSLELLEMYGADDPSKAREKLDFAKRTTQAALKATRDLSKELREPSTEEGLEVALSNHLRVDAPPDVHAWVSAKGDESLIPPKVREELFLILREAMRNAITHSGAGNIRVALDTSQHWVLAAVEDDGHGFDPEENAASGGTGLTSMKERTSILGGTFSLTTGLGKGTRISILVPLPEDAT